jgi:hypothetical protein
MSIIERKLIGSLFKILMHFIYGCLQIAFGKELLFLISEVVIEIDIDLLMSYVVLKQLIKEPLAAMIAYYLDLLTHEFKHFRLYLKYGVVIFI